MARGPSPGANWRTSNLPTRVPRETPAHQHLPLTPAHLSKADCLGSGQQAHRHKAQQSR